MSSKKILIFMGTVRPGRMAERVTTAVKSVVSALGMEPLVLGKIQSNEKKILFSSPFSILKQTNKLSTIVFLL